MKDPVVGAVMGGSNPRDVIVAAINPQHEIVSGQGAMPADSVGFPWNGRFIVASGNLLADFRSNLHAESQGLMQAVRLDEMTNDKGVRDHLSFMIARDTMHQNQWLAAIEELQSDGFEETVVPKIAYEYGAAHRENAYPQPLAAELEPPQPNPNLHATPKSPAMQKTSDNGLKNAVDSVTEVAGEILSGNKGTKKENRPHKG